MATIKLGGGPNPPVILDPAQVIVNVHWNDDDGGPGGGDGHTGGPSFLIRENWNLTSAISCGSPTGSYDAATMALGYIWRFYISAMNDVNGAGFSLNVDGDIIGVSASGWPTFADWVPQIYSAWLYTSQVPTPNLGVDVTAAGTTVSTALNCTGLDGAPQCRVVPQAIPVNRVAAGRIGPTSAPGPSLDFGAGRLTEIGGAERVFRPISAIIGGSGTAHTISFLFEEGA